MYHRIGDFLLKRRLLIKTLQNQVTQAVAYILQFIFNVPCVLNDFPNFDYYLTYEARLERDNFVKLRK